MIRNLKTLALALVAVLAMSAVVASAVQAAPQFTCSVYPCTVTGSNTAGNETLTTPGGTVQCDSHFEGTLSGASTQLTIVPSFSECVGFGFLNANVTEEGCVYRIISTSRLGESHYRKRVDLICPGTGLTIVAGTCHLDIPSQNGIEFVTTLNLFGVLRLTFQMSKTKMIVTKDGFGCPFTGTGETTGSYHGEVSLANTGGGGSVSASGS